MFDSEGTQSSMSLSIADVAKVAVLARLRLSPEELETFTGQLNSIVDYVAQLQELDTTGVEPLAHGIELRNVFRDDVRGPALEREQALANAPKRNHGELSGSRRSGVTQMADARSIDSMKPTDGLQDCWPG